jgi:hypothetical protein
MSESYDTWLNEMNELLLDIGWHINHQSPEISEEAMAEIRKKVMVLYESLAN